MLFASCSVLVLPDQCSTWCPALEVTYLHEVFMVRFLGSLFLSGFSHCNRCSARSNLGGYMIVSHPDLLSVDSYLSY